MRQQNRQANQRLWDTPQGGDAIQTRIITCWPQKMKYELPPNNRDCPDEVLLTDLRAVAGQLGRNTVRRDEYATRGRFHPKTLVNRFGSWNAALTKAGLGTTKLQNIPNEELLADLKIVAEKIGNGTVNSGG